MSSLRICLFGRFEVKQENQVQTGAWTRRAQELLCYLVLHNNSLAEKTTARNAAKHLQRPIQRSADEVAGPVSLLAKNNAGILQPGQMRKTEFLEQLKEISSVVADDALAHRSQVKVPSHLSRSESVPRVKGAWIYACA
jgi:hypothetical protein